MKSSVITNQESTNHFVENYRFKVLGSAEQRNRRASDRGEAEGVLTNYGRRATDRPPEDPSKNETSATNDASTQQQEEDHDDGFESSFIEELLRKTDELSGNIIKLQMQIENQEIEFARRLETETARAKEDGIAAGIAQANQVYDAQLAELNERFASSVSKLANFYNGLEDFLQKSEDELGQAAISVAQQVIVKEISTGSGNVAYALSKSLMAELKEAKDITLRVSPADAKFLAEQFEQNKHVIIEADDAISKGGVVIISEAGNIDGTIATRLEKLKSLV